MGEQTNKKMEEHTDTTMEEHTNDDNGRTD